MTIMVVTMKSVSVAEAKAKLSELLGRVAYGGERITIERRGKPMAALVPVADMERGDENARGDWLDSVVGLCADDPEFCDILDQIVTERHQQAPREISFPWEEDDDPSRH